MPCIAIRAGEWSSRALYARLSGPEIAKVEGDRIERTDAHRLVVLRARDQQPLPVVELERIESAIDRVDEPQVEDAREGVTDCPALERSLRLERSIGAGVEVAGCTE